MVQEDACCFRSLHLFGSPQVWIRSQQEWEGNATAALPWDAIWNLSDLFEPWSFRKWDVFFGWKCNDMVSLPIPQALSGLVCHGPSIKASLSVSGTAQWPTKFRNHFTALTFAQLLLGPHKGRIYKHTPSEGWSQMLLLWQMHSW